MFEFEDEYEDNEAIITFHGLVFVRSGDSITIYANIVFKGPLDKAELISGIKKYWEGSYVIDGKKYSVSVQITQFRFSPLGHITYYTDAGNGISYTHPYQLHRYDKDRPNSVYLYAHYEHGEPKNIGWVAAHEFGHILGISDYNGYTPSPGEQSIMNDIGVHASNKELKMVISAFRTGNYQIWGR